MSPQRRSYRRGPRAWRYAWVPGHDEGNSTTNAITVTDDLIGNYKVDTQQETMPGFVIVRVIGNLKVGTANSSIGNETPWYFGVGANKENVSTPTNPQTEVGRFLWYIADTTDRRGIESQTDVFKAYTNTYYFDVKGQQRLVDVGDSLIGVMEAVGAGEAVEWSIFTRTLIRIP